MTIRTLLQAEHRSTAPGERGVMYRCWAPTSPTAPHPEHAPRAAVELVHKNLLQQSRCSVAIEPQFCVMEICTSSSCWSESFGLDARGLVAELHE